MIGVLALLLSQAPAPLAGVPFMHTPGRIWFTGTLNGNPVQAALDSGAGGILAAEPAAKKAGGTKGKSFASETLGGSTDVWEASGLMFGIPGSGVQLPVRGIVSLARLSGKNPPEVVAGFELLSALVVEIDYVHSRLRFYMPYAYQPPKGAVGVPITFVQGQPFAAVKVRLPGGKAEDAKALIDTGNPPELDVSLKFARAEGADRHYENIPITDQAGGVGGRTKGKVVKGASVEIGGAKLTVPAIIEMTDKGGGGSKAAQDVIVGDGILRHFDVTFDYAHEKIWLKPNGK